MRTLRVEVVYALPGRQIVRALRLPEGSLVGDAVRASRLLEEFPEIDPDLVGIYGRKVEAGAALRDRDRVELYRPLSADPKEIRRRRARSRRARGP
ncbi:MAG TPA: RnfH family protein [Burkholderiales bacterium]|jgi:putative ubiquitin-RnfH superfamily antitoxin RatB of RatAB toxin-antitoxin module